MVIKKFTVLACSLGLALVLIAGIFLGACSTPAPVTTTSTATATATTTVATTTTATATTTSVIKPIVLRLAPATANPPPASGHTQVWVDVIKLLQDRTGGKVIIQPYWSQSLVPSNQTVTALQNGVADIGTISPHQEPGKVPLALVGQLPGIGTDLWARARAYWDLCNQDPEKSELSKYNIKPITTLIITEQYIISRIPLRSLADIKGKKISASGISAELISTLGAVPVAMAPPDQYSGLEKGTIDGIVVPTGGVWDFKFFEVGKYFTYLSCGSRIYPVGMNQDVWNKLPVDVQKVFNDSVPDLISIAYTDFVNTADNVALQAMKDVKVEFINLSEADNKAVAAAQALQADKWAAGMGDPGKKILSDYRALVAKYEPLSPFKK
jgi:TRAP-type C4-dicarboxylate transport system substrate-binding protein